MPVSVQAAPVTPAALSPAELPPAKWLRASLLLPWLLLVVGLVATYLLQQRAVTAAHNELRDNFDYQVREFKLRIAQRLAAYEHILLGTRGLFAAAGNVERAEFREYVSNLRLASQYPGIQGIGYALLVAPEARVGHIEAIRQQGFPEYTLRPAGERAQYSAIVYIEPFVLRNLRAFGYDMFSEAVRRAAMEESRDSDKPILSGQVTLVQETTVQETTARVQAGVLLYVPVYRNGQPRATLAERRANILGWVYATFRMDDLMQGILGDQAHALRLEIFDGQHPGAGALLHDNLRNTASLQAGEPRYLALREIEISGRAWTIRLSSLPAFEAGIDTGPANVIGLAGLSITVLLAALAWALGHARRRALSLASNAIECVAAAEDLRDSEERFRRLFEDNSSVMLVIDPARRSVVDANQAAAAFYGYARARLADMPVAEIACQSAPDPDLAWGAGGQPVLATHRLATGATREVELHATSLDSGGRLLLYVIVLDVTDRLRNAEKQQLAASVFTHAREGIMIMDADGTLVDVNQAFTDISGYARDEVLGQPQRLMGAGPQKEEVYAAMWSDLAEKGHWYGEVWHRRKSGESYVTMQNISAVRDAKGVAQQFVALFSDITSIKAQQQQLEDLAHYDALTHLPNRVLLTDRLRQGMAQVQRRGQVLAVAYLDLDGFKAVNDLHGHQVGDRLLVALADSMRQTLREGDTLARIGGDEFVAVLLDLTDAAASAELLARLLAAVARPVQIGGANFQVSASLGVTFYPQAEAVDSDLLLRQADQAMYQAKQGGRNRYHVFDVEMDRSMHGHHESVERIRLALAQHEFRLLYQPKVNMRTGAIVGAEALIRWQHPQRGLLAPAAFLPEVEAHPLAVAIGEWVIDEALSQVERWRAAGLDIPVSVNVGARQLQQLDFVDRLRAILAAHPLLQPGCLELEILETGTPNDIAQVSRLIDGCNAIGVTFALDDFGTGYSSLTYLKRLKVTTLKIDQRFVRGMPGDPEDQAILQGVIGMAAAFNRKVIAEGVETVAHGATLLVLGCDLAQGYGIAMPMPAEDLLQWSATWRPEPGWTAPAWLGATA